MGVYNLQADFFSFSIYGGGRVMLLVVGVDRVSLTPAACPTMHGRYEVDYLRVGVIGGVLKLFRTERFGGYKI